MTHYLEKCIIVFVMCFLLTPCYGQSKKVEPGIYKGRQYIFDVKQSQNGKNILIETLPIDSASRVAKKEEIMIIDERIMLENKTLVPAIVKSVLADKYTALKNQKSFFLVRMYPLANGNLNAVGYIMKSDFDISVEELEDITKKIMEQVKVKLPENLDKGKQIAPIVQNVRFR